MPSEGVNDVAVLGNLLGVITDRGKLLAVDVSQPLAPVFKAVVDVSLCADCVGVSTTGSGLVIGASAAGLRTASLPDLKELGSDYPNSLTTPLDYEQLVVSGNIAYVADWYYGLRIYDVSNPAKPTELGKLGGGVVGPYFLAIAYSAGRVYLGKRTNGGQLAVVDVSDPNHPTLLGSITTDGTLGLAVRGSLVYVADAASGTKGGLKIFDVSNPASIKLVGVYTQCTLAQSVAVAGRVAVVGCSDGYHFVDVFFPNAMVQRAKWAPKSPGSGAAVSISGTRAYLGHADGVTVVDFTDPLTPKVLDQKPTSFEVRNISQSSPDHVIAASGYGGVYQWDFSQL
jgi:hypothetical protein